MKNLLFALLTFLFVKTNAQDCVASLLFQKGAELEYKTYGWEAGVFFGKSKFIETTKLLYTVSDVKDSAGNKYSYITKKGTNPVDEKMTYIKKYVLVCNGKSIIIPFDFYTPDTVFFSNYYHKINDKGIYTAINCEGGSYEIPLNLEKDKASFTANSVKINMTLRHFVMERNTSVSNNVYYAPGARIEEAKRSSDALLKNINMQGKEKLKTEAGEFDCYKMNAVFDVDFMGKIIDGSAFLFYSPEIGVLKIETAQAKYKAGYVELFRIKK